MCLVNRARVKVWTGSIPSGGSLLQTLAMTVSSCDSHISISWVCVSNGKRPGMLLNSLQGMGQSPEQQTDDGLLNSNGLKEALLQSLVFGTVTKA